jgi:hypothetical protein
LAELTSIQPGTLALGLALGGVAAAWLYAFDPAKGGLYPVCYFHQTTGLLCPGCGGLRALHQLLHGHLAAAWHFNPLLVLFLPLAAWMAGGGALNLLRGRPATFVVRPAWLWLAGGVVLVFGILRNLPCPQLAWLGLHP